MSLFLTIVLIGVSATTAMTIFLYVVRALQITDVHMLDALGTLITRNTLHARRIGMAIHYTTGVFFAFLYMWAAGYFGFNTPRDFFLFGVALGLMHGVIFSFFVVVLVAEHHPVPHFRQHGFAVVAAYGVAHIIYGLTIGLSAALLEPNLESFHLFN